MAPRPVERAAPPRRTRASAPAAGRPATCPSRPGATTTTGRTTRASAACDLVAPGPVHAAARAARPRRRVRPPRPRRRRPASGRYVLDVQHPLRAVPGGQQAQQRRPGRPRPAVSPRSPCAPAAADPVARAPRERTAAWLGGRAVARCSRRSARRQGSHQEEVVDLSVTSREEGGRTVVEVGGEIDVYTAPTLRERLNELVGPGHHHLVVDMEQRRVPRLHRPGRPRRRPEAGPLARRVAAPGVHAGEDPQGVPDHRADQGLPDPRLRRRRRRPSGAADAATQPDAGPERRTTVATVTLRFTAAARARADRPAGGGRRGAAGRAWTTRCSTRSGSRSARPARAPCGAASSPAVASVVDMACATPRTGSTSS